MMTIYGKKMIRMAFLLSFLAVSFLFPSQAFSDPGMLLGETTVTLKTRDGVKIVGSFFLPSDYFRDAEPSGEKIIFEVDLWNDLEKEFLVIAAPVKKGRVTRIAIKEGDFTFAEGELYPLSEQDVKQEEPESQEKVIVPPYIPLIPEREKSDFINRVFSPYGALHSSFKIELLSKNTNEKKADLPESDKGFRLLIKKSTPLLDNSCFNTVSEKKKRHYPAVILLHMWQRDRNEWRPLVPYFQNAGIAVLSIDLRGHGESLYRNSRKLHLKKFVTKNYKDMIKDAFAAYEFLIVQELVDPKRISIVGASLGTVIAIKLCAKVNHLKPASSIRSVTVMSPSKNFFAVKVSNSIKKCEATPMLFIMDKQDPTKEKNNIFVSGSLLYNSFRGPKEALVFEGAGHGTEMYMKRPELKSAIVDWVRVHSR